MTKKYVKFYRYKLILVLIEELQKRKKKNFRYSLRSFAKYLDYESSFLSKIMRGVLPITKDQFDKIVSRLEISADDKLLLYQDIIFETQRVDLLYVNEKEFSIVSENTFELISKWYFDVLISCTKLDDFQCSPKWLSSKIGITEQEADSSIKILLKSEILKQDFDGKTVLSEENLLAFAQDGAGYENKDLLRNHLSGLSKKITEQLETAPFGTFLYGSTSITIDSSLIKYANKKMQSFLKDLSAELEEKSSKRDQVYEMTISLTPWLKN